MFTKLMLFAFVGWTFTSFVCHYCAKHFIVESTALMSGKENVIILTILQVMFYMQVASFSKENDKDAMFHKLLIFTAHACATLATNWSMALTYAASTFAIKLMEPLTSAVLQSIILKMRLSCVQLICIPAVVTGAMVFTKENNKEILSLSNGTVLAFISNLCLSLRNIYMKNHLSNAASKTLNTLPVSGVYVRCTTGALILIYLVKIEMAPTGSFKIFIFLFGSSLFHAIYSYISTVIVLNHFSIVGHAFGNIFKRLAVLGLLYITGTRTASLSNFIGLAICVTGLAIYAFSKTWEDYNYYGNHVSNSLFSATMRSKRLVFVMVVIVVLLVSMFHSDGILQIISTEKKCKTIHSEGKKFRNVSLHDLSLSKQAAFNIEHFYSLDLTSEPEEANKLSPLLTKRQDVIDEAQRIHMNIFKKLLGGYRYAMLLDYAPSENKGDSAITVGEIFLLRKLNIKIVFACSIPCYSSDLHQAENISTKYSSQDLVVLFQGGGNVIGYPLLDKFRFRQLRMFKQFNIIMFPQSILYIKSGYHIQLCEKWYASHPRLTFVWRDKVSFNLGKNLFPKVRSLMSPDMAYQIGFVPRFMQPTFDILWIKRADKKSPVYHIPESPKGFRMHVSDCLGWKTPRGHSHMEDTFLMTTNGMMFFTKRSSSYH